jgi:Anticodon binding domain of methionyl tRNA ligase
MEFRKACAETRAIWASGNEYLTVAAPWTKLESDRPAAETAVRVGLELCVLFAHLAEPFIPATAQRIRGGFGKENLSSIWPNAFNGRQLLFDRADLLTDQCQPCHVAPELLDDVRRQARALRCPQACQTFWRLAQMWLESPDPETGERTLHAVGDAW